MKYLLFIFCITLSLNMISCNNSESEEKRETNVSEALQDSLMNTADSLIHERGLIQGKHIHNGQDLAAKAHQNPKAQREGIEYKRKRNEGRRRSRIAANSRIQAQQVVN